MSYFFEKFYPFRGRQVFMSSLKILVIAEGYLSSERSQFNTDVMNLYEGLYRYPGMTGMIRNDNSLSIYTLFIASNNHGFASSQASASNRTALDSYYDSSSGSMFFNETKLDAILNDSYANDSSVQHKISDHLSSLRMRGNLTSTIVVVLTPAVSNVNAEGEYENSSYYKIITSADGYFEQTIIRAIAKMAGLGDEFELSGANYAAPGAEIGSMVDGLFINLAYIDNSSNAPNPSVDVNFKWRLLFPYNFNSQLTVHPHPGTNTTADRTLPTTVAAYSKIELWEGGGGYRSKIYRSGYDCLLRRRIGDTALPTKSQRVGFCGVCHHYFRILFSK